MSQYKNDITTDFFIGLPKATGPGGAVVNSVYSAYAFLANGTTSTNAYTLTSKQAYRNKTDTYQINGGSTWTTGRAVLSSELTYNHSTLPNRNVIVDTSFNAPVIAINNDVNGTPVIRSTGVNVNDPSQFTVRTLFDNHSVATSRQWAWRGDLFLHTDGGFFRSLKAGFRYTDRRADSQATASNPVGIANRVSLASVQGLAYQSPDDLVHGLSGIGSFADANQDFLLNINTSAVRALFSQPAGDRAYDPNLAFLANERTYAFYGSPSSGSPSPDW